jgi:hypothetical protein
LNLPLFLRLKSIVLHPEGCVILGNRVLVAVTPSVGLVINDPVPV